MRWTLWREPAGGNACNRQGSQTHAQTQMPSRNPVHLIMRTFFDSIHPAFYMILAVVVFSTNTVIYDLGAAWKSPFLFAGFREIGLVTGLVGPILFFGRGLQLDRALAKGVAGDCVSWLMLGSVLGAFGFVSFVFGLKFVGISAAAVIYETWPVFIMLMMAFLFRGKRRYRPITWSTILFSCIAVAGVGLVIVSQNVSHEPLSQIWSHLNDHRMFFGVGLVLLAAVSAATHGACALKLSTLLSEKYVSDENREKGEVFFALLVTCVAVTLSAMLHFAPGLMRSESISWSSMVFAFATSMFITAPGVIAWRVANLKTHELGLNALSLATPILSLLWIWLLSTLDVPHLDYLIIGTTGVLAANLLINTCADARPRYKALVMSLWVFGTLLYLTGESWTHSTFRPVIAILVLVLLTAGVFLVFRRLEAGTPLPSPIYLSLRPATQSDTRCSGFPSRRDNDAVSLRIVPLVVSSGIVVMFTVLFFSTKFGA